MRLFIEAYVDKLLASSDPETLLKKFDTTLDSLLTRACSAVKVLYGLRYIIEDDVLTFSGPSVDNPTLAASRLRLRAQQMVVFSDIQGRIEEMGGVVGLVDVGKFVRKWKAVVANRKAL